jgi:ATP-dependent exoDNAse (exonuclease V) beta subunit
MLGRARTYDVRGLKQLAVDLVTEWNTGVSFDEAGSDHTIDSIDVITVHKAKGLEWPIDQPRQASGADGRVLLQSR